MEKTQFKMNLPNDLKSKLFVRSCMNDTSISEEIVNILRKDLDRLTAENPDCPENVRMMNMIGDLNIRLKPIEKWFNMVTSPAYRLDQDSKKYKHDMNYNELSRKIEALKNRIDEICVENKKQGFDDEASLAAEKLMMRHPEITHVKIKK